MAKRRSAKPKKPKYSASYEEWVEYEKAIKKYEEDTKKKKEIIQKLKFR
jgi:hypothetical protein